MQNKAVSPGAKAEGLAGRQQRLLRGATVRVKRRWMRSAMPARRPSDQAAPISVTSVWQAVAAGSGGDGDGGEVAEVDEIGEGAEAGVGADRVGGAGLESGAERGGGDQDRVHLGEETGGDAAALRQLVKGGEGIDRAAVEAGFEDGASSGMQGFGLRLDECSQGGRPFGDPRAFVEQPGDGQERRQIERHGVEQGGRALVCCADLGIAVGQRGGHANPEDRAVAVAAQMVIRRRARVGVRVVVAGGDAGDGQAPRPTVRAKTEIVSIERQAGQGLSWRNCPPLASARRRCRTWPARGLNPAVSVPSAKAAMPAATAQAEPEEEPPGTRLPSNGLRGMP